jgi:hypothetical protein
MAVFLYPVMPFLLPEMAESDIPPVS